MITAVKLPKLTLTMESATVVKWLKREGDPVRQDEPLFELETDKAVVEVPAPTPGLLARIVVRDGEVAVGTTVAFIGDTGDALPDNPETVHRISSATPPSPLVTDRSQAVPKVRATPAARRRARELGVALDGLEGTGPNGQITQEDIEKLHLRSGSQSGPCAEDYRRKIAERTSNAWRTAPHIHIGGDLSAGGVITAFENGRRLLGQPLTITDVLLHATALVLREFQSLNAIWRGDYLETQSRIHLAFAVQSDFGVITPVIHDADRLSISELSSMRKNLASRASERRLKPTEVSDGTFTVTNLGMYPVDFFAPIINHPQIAILATGRARRVAGFCNDQVSPEWRMWANLALDHRAADGATGAQFLKRLEEVFANLPSHIQ